MRRKYVLLGGSVALAIILGVGCGTDGGEWPRILKSCDGVLYLQTMKGAGLLFGRLTIGSNGSTTLYASMDQGRSWNRIGKNWNDFLFLDRRHGFLTRGESLYETTDGRVDKAEPLHRFPSVIEALSKVGGRLMVSAGNRLFESRDGRNWAAVDFAPVRHGNRPVAVAGDDSNLAVATGQGWVWLRNRDGSWRRFIVGPVLDLAFSRGAFYALTGMATVAVLDGESVRHHRLPPRYLSGARFGRSGDRLLFATQDTLYELVDGALVPRLQFETTVLAPPLLAMLGEDEVVRVSWSGPDGFSIESVNLRLGEVQELAGLPVR